MRNRTIAHIKESFKKNIFWNVGEAFYYRLLFCTHTFLLYNVVDTHTVGFIGTLFSSLYLAINICDFGLTKSFAPFFADISKNQKMFNAFIKTQLIYHAIAWVVPFANVYVFYTWNLYTITLSPLLQKLLIIIFISESIKNIAKIILQLAFWYHETVFAEIVAISSFCICTWGYYWTTGIMTPVVIFGAMAASSMLATSILLFCFTLWYKKIPQKKHAKTYVFKYNLLQNRTTIYINELSDKIIFSSNFLIPFIAYHSGFVYAGSFKLVSNITQVITIIIYHAFQIPSLALFSGIKRYAHEKIETIFAMVNTRLYRVLKITSVAIIAAFGYVLATNPVIKYTTNIPTLFLFFALLFMENFFITYRSFYIVQEQTIIFFLSNGIPLLFFGFFIFTKSVTTLFGILMLLFCSRLCSLFLISYFYKSEKKNHYAISTTQKRK